MSRRPDGTGPGVEQGPRASRSAPAPVPPPAVPAAEQIQPSARLPSAIGAGCVGRPFASPTSSGDSLR